MKTDFLKWFGPIRNSSCSELIDKYATLKPDHSFYREVTWDKFFAGFGFGYLLFRELPLRNFYARAFVMYLFLGKFFDHFPVLPFSGRHGKLRGTWDEWHNWDIRCYDNAYKAMKFINIPTVANRVRES